jgi:lipid A 3-O-deacylase
LLTAFCLLCSRLGQGALLPSPSDSTAKGIYLLRPERSVAYTFANDAPFRTDYYFTQGMSLTVVLPAFQRLPTRHLLLREGLGTSRYGIRVRYDGFTPLRIQDPFIRLTDRPYASYIYATLFHSRNSPTDRARLTTGLQMGVIGPAVGAKGFQTAVHRWIDAPTPRGWDFQIRNDVVLGYEIGGEWELLTAGRGLEIIGTGRAALSTLRTVAGAGAIVRAGLFDPYFSSLLGVTADGRDTGHRAVQLYAEARAEAQAVGYDATMQGGLFNRTSPYTLPASAVRRGVVMGSTALVLGIKGVAVRGSATWVTPEIQGGRSHAWGQIDFTAAL